MHRRLAGRTYRHAREGHLRRERVGTCAEADEFDRHRHCGADRYGARQWRELFHRPRPQRELGQPLRRPCLGSGVADGYEARARLRVIAVDAVGHGGRKGERGDLGLELVVGTHDGVGGRCGQSEGIISVVGTPGMPEILYLPVERALAAWGARRRAGCFAIDNRSIIDA